MAATVGLHAPPPSLRQRLIRSEEARQQTLSQLGASIQTTPQMAIAYQSIARKNIAYLQARYSQIQCEVLRVAPTAPVLAAPPQQLCDVFAGNDRRRLRAILRLLRPTMTFAPCWA